MRRLTDDSGVRLVDVRPTRSYFTTGVEWAVNVELHTDTSRDGELAVRATNPAALPVAVTTTVHLPAGRTVVSVALPTPHGGPAAWQLEAEFSDLTGCRVAGTGALDVLDDWRSDPRYGFLCEFGPDSNDVAERTAAMRRYHLTCVQLYDWAYRHHQLLPLEEDYADVLGREMSLRAVRAAIDAAHAEGMAALGYATIYAAEREFTEEHADWQIYDDQGRPWHLADLFFLMDLSLSCGWAEHMLEQLRSALEVLPLDGFHLDQYGFPRVASTLAGKSRDTARGFVDFVARANEQIDRQRPTGGAIFNNVNAWPLNQTAPVAQVANYIEVWRPHTDYRDLAELTHQALRATPGTPVILAAYPGFLRKEPTAREAVGGLALLTAVTLASGAWPLMVGEGDRILTGGYYPEHVDLSQEAQAVVTSLLDAGVAWREFLRGPQCERVADAFIDGQDAEITLDLPYSSRPIPGHVWVSLIRRPGWLAVSMVNLLQANTAFWNRPQPVPTPRAVNVIIPQGVDATQSWVAGERSAWSSVPASQAGAQRSVRVHLGIWSLLVFPHADPVD